MVTVGNNIHYKADGVNMLRLNNNVESSPQQVWMMVMVLASFNSNDGADHYNLESL